MDLMELRSLYDQTVTQIQVLEIQLRDLVQRQTQMSSSGCMTEFDYTQFKISILEGVINMYEQYRDQKWTQLQKASAISLEEIIYGDVRSRSETESTEGREPSHSEMEWTDEEITIHMIPAVLTPIRDLDDLLPTPPGSPTLPDVNIFTRNLLDFSLTSDFPVTREL